MIMFDEVKTYKLNLDLSNTCRLCLAKNVDMTNIYSQDTDISLLDKIQSLASVTISRNDGLPALICAECLSSIEYYTEFRNKIEFSYRYLCNFVNQHSGEKDNSKSAPSLEPPTSSTKQIQHDECIAVNFTDKMYDPHLHEKSKSKEKEMFEEYDQLSSTVHNNEIISSTDKLPLDFYADNYLIEPPEIPKEYVTCTDGVTENFNINETEVLINIFNCNDNYGTDGLDYLNKLLKEDDTHKMVNLKDVSKNDTTVNKLVEKNTQTISGNEVSNKPVKKKQEMITSEHTEAGHEVSVRVRNQKSQILSTRMAFFEKSLQINEQEEIMPRITEIKMNDSDFEKAYIELDISTYFCQICLEEFASYDIAVFFYHSVSHFGNVGLNQISPPFDCELCTEQLTSRYKFILHQRMHCNVEPFKCVDCENQFLNLELLKDHQRKYIQCSKLGKIYICHICGKRFKRKSDLTYHAGTHVLKRKNFQCDLCNSLHSNEKVLGIHRRRHFATKKFSCDKCDKSFHLRGDLMRHDQLHTGQRKFPCLICEKAFMSKSELKRHSVYHSEERNYKCDLCDKSFYESHHATEHRKTHEKKSFVCEVCGDSFPTACKFKNHLKIHKPGKKIKKSSQDDTDNHFQIVTLPAGVTALEGLRMELVESCEDDGLIIIAEGTEEAMNEMTYLIVDN